jgi:hypothetical protein
MKGKFLTFNDEVYVEESSSILDEDLQTMVDNHPNVTFVKENTGADEVEVTVEGPDQATIRAAIADFFQMAEWAVGVDEDSEIRVEWID